jgi:hypothetical protein
MSNTDALSLLAMGLAVGGLSTTIAKAHIMGPVRAWMGAGVSILGEMLACPYCISHWIALGVAIVAPIRVTGNVWTDGAVQVFALVALGALVTGGIMRSLLWHEAELEELRGQLESAKSTLRELAGDN